MPRFYTRLRALTGTAGGRLSAALACYAILLGLALYTLLPARTRNEEFLLGVVLLVLAILTVKTIAHSRRGEQQE